MSGEGRPTTEAAEDTVWRARGATVWTRGGEVLVDLASGGFGYGDPSVRSRVSEQARALPLSTRMLYSEPLARLCDRLSRLLPPQLRTVFPANSGSEAMEGALKLAKGFYPRRRRLVAAAGAYHGSTLGALGVCGAPGLRRLLGELPVEARLVPYGDVGALERAVDEETSAVVLEPVGLGDGVRPPPPGYLAAARRRCRETGALFVADEVATGLGATGRRWGTDHDGVAPDVTVLGGALGGGVMPLGLYASTRAVNEGVYRRRDPALHATTTGGNPLACTAALAALEVVEERGLAASAAETGKRIGAQLRALVEANPGTLVQSAGRGLLAGLRARDAECARAIRRSARERGALLGAPRLASGDAWVVLRVPLQASAQEIERGLEALTGAVAGGRAVA